jgi:hypothetical protein
LNTGLVVAVVGAGVAVLAAITGVARWLWRKRTRIQVTVALGWVTRGPQRTPAIDMVALNKSAFAVTVMEWGIEQLGNDVSPDPRLNEMRLPHVLVPGAALTETAGPQDFLSGYVSLHSPLTAWVQLANGKRFNSQRYTPGPGKQQHGGTRAV